MSSQSVTRSRRLSSGLAGLAAAALGVVAGSASATPIEYTMTWNSASGQYGSTLLSDARVTLKFTTDTTNVGVAGSSFPLSSWYAVAFANGAGISVTVINNQGSSPVTILNDASLDNVSANNSALVATGTSIFFGTAGGSPLSYGTDRGGINGFASAPSASDMLTTTWSSTSNGFISNPWSGNPLVIGTQTLWFGQSPNTQGGSWGSVLGSPSGVPGTGLAAIGTLGLAGVARRRRR